MDLPKYVISNMKVFEPFFFPGGRGGQLTSCISYFIVRFRARRKCYPHLSFRERKSVSVSRLSFQEYIFPFRSNRKEMKREIIPG